MAPDLVNVTHRDKTFRFELLDECSISDHLRRTKTFYELEFLESLASLLDPSTIVLDVGAHIGNHTVFLAGTLGLQVKAYEPNPHAFKRLKRNVAMNALEDKVTCFPIALSDGTRDVMMAPTVPSDLGTMAVTEESDGGAIGVTTGVLDDIEIEPSRPVFVKLDVEGHEPAVIRGAQRFLRDYEPDLSVEIQSAERFDEILDLLGEQYLPRDVFNATPTVLFRPSSAVGDKSHQDHLTRYAISNAIDYRHSRKWYIAEKSRSEELSSLAQDRLSNIEAELADLKSELKSELEALRQRQERDVTVGLAAVNSDLEALRQRQDVTAKVVRSHDVKIARLRIDQQLKRFPKWLWSRLRSSSRD